MKIRLLSIVALLGLGSTLVFGQAQVREAGTPRGAAAQPVAGNDLIMSLYNQVEALQQEVQTLRGVVEEQGYQLKRLQTEARDRYLDIDRRLSTQSPAPSLGGPMAPISATGTPVPPTGAPLDTAAAAASSPSSGSPAVTSVPAVVPPPSSTPAVTPAGSTAAIQDEQELYRTALNLLLDEGKYNESVAMFQTYIDRYPQGRLFTNALYWQGEAYLLASGFTEARDVFNRLLNEYPQDAKAAGAMLKLGMAYKQMGDTTQAAETWRGLRARFPESANEIRLAEENLKGL